MFNFLTVMAEFISIHAPYKRVRLSSGGSSSDTVSVISIHAPYKRVRLISTNSKFIALIFQSTHPTRECDPVPIQRSHKRSDFNPRTLQESATLTLICVTTKLIFQSTHPTRECDSGVLSNSLALVGISIHAPYKRVRHQLFPLFLCWVYFNPRTLQESATAIYSKKIAFSQYIGLKILIRNKKYPSLK